MTTSLEKVDSLQTDIVACAYKSVPLDDWASMRMYAKYAIDGGVGGLDFDYVLPDGTLHQQSIPSFEHQAELYALTKQHWQLVQQLGQPRWFKMIVTVERSGKFSVSFEYKEKITDEDMIQRG
jgi:Protein of unknown function, DUF600